jgi:hypothetical protein
LSHRPLFPHSYIHLATPAHVWGPSHRGRIQLPTTRHHQKKSPYVTTQHPSKHSPCIIIHRTQDTSADLCSLLGRRRSLVGPATTTQPSTCSCPTQACHEQLPRPDLCAHVLSFHLASGFRFRPAGRPAAPCPRCRSHSPPVRHGRPCEEWRLDRFPTLRP